MYDGCDFLGKFKYEPYVDGLPKFSLTLYDTFQSRDGKRKLAYEFRQDQELIFHGDDFYCSPLHAIDSQECANSLLGFLSLRPGDTDDEYFDNYSERQMDFALEHGESLAIFCYDD